MSIWSNGAARPTNEDKVWTHWVQQPGGHWRRWQEVLEAQWGQCLAGVGPREEGREGMNKSLADFCPKGRRGKCDRKGSFIAGRKGSMCPVPADGDDPTERGQSWVTGTGRESTHLC